MPRRRRTGRERRELEHNYTKPKLNTFMHYPSSYWTRKPDSVLTHMKCASLGGSQDDDLTMGGHALRPMLPIGKEESDGA